MKVCYSSTKSEREKHINIAYMLNVSSFHKGGGEGRGGEFYPFVPKQDEPRFSNNARLHDFTRPFLALSEGLYKRDTTRIYTQTDGQT